jgi:ABC-2 type transport system ATP-binding protein
MSIQVNNLSKNYGNQKAIDSINFEIPAGQIVGFLGPNGAGKSTTMKILTGFIPPSSGSASICGIDVEENPLKTKELIGYLPEHNPLYLDMYVKEYLNFMAEIQGVKKIKERTSEIIEITGLQLEKRKKIGQLSKGYRQRVGLAQALIHDPQVLILDEPTSGFDPNQLADIRELIKKIGKEKTVLLSTHIMQEVEAICERVIVIDLGKIVADAKTTEIGQSNSKEIVIHVEFSENINPNAMKEYGEIISFSPNESSKKFKVKTANSTACKIALNKIAANHNAYILEQNEEKQSLEQIFKSLTNHVHNI